MEIPLRGLQSCKLDRGLTTLWGRSPTVRTTHKVTMSMSKTSATFQGNMHPILRITSRSHSSLWPKLQRQESVSDQKLWAAQLATKTQHIPLQVVHSQVFYIYACIMAMGVDPTFIPTYASKIKLLHSWVRASFACLKLAARISHLQASALFGLLPASSSSWNEEFLVVWLSHPPPNSQSPW
jgi:hypothetical protein